VQVSVDGSTGPAEMADKVAGEIGRLLETEFRNRGRDQ
jgi:hypothetical protein